MNRFAHFSERKVNWQTNENIESSARAGNQDMLAIFDMVEDGKIKFHRLSTRSGSLSLLDHTDACDGSGSDGG